MKIIVTGAFGSLGRAVCGELETRGATVARIDVAPAPDGAEGLVFGGVDLADAQTVADTFANVVSALGGLTGLVNVAGGFCFETMADGSIDSWDAMYGMNLRTAALCSHAAIEHLGRGGSIVNIAAAAAASVPVGEGMAPYAASKAGVIALTESLSEELATRGVRANAVLPTILDTPANREAMPDADTANWVRTDSAAKAIAFLLSDDSAAVTGATIRLASGA